MEQKRQRITLSNLWPSKPDWIVGNAVIDFDGYFGAHLRQAAAENKKWRLLVTTIPEKWRKEGGAEYRVQLEELEAPPEEEPPF